MSPQLLSAIPRLPSADFDRTLGFYQLFGFREIARYTEGYLILRSDGAELHFFTAPRGHRPEDNPHGAYIRIMNSYRFAEAYRDLGLPPSGAASYQPPSLRPWGMIEAYVSDPDGNFITFGAPQERPPEGP